MHAESLGAGPDLVMVPGWGMASAVWRDLAQLLSAEWRVTLIDLPGHGDNRAVPFQPDDAAQRLADAAPPNAVWLAWSLGAQLALSAALAGAPMAGLVLLGATPRFVAGEDWPHGVDPASLTDLRRRVQQDPRRGLARFIGLLGWGAPVHADAARTLRARLAGVVHDPDGLLDALDWLTATDLRPRLPAMPPPAWWIAGGADPLVPPPVADIAAASMARGRAEHIPGAGHMPFLTHRQRLLSVLARARTITAP